MQTLTYAFNSTTREQLATFIRNIASLIDPDLIHDGDFPFIISIDGSRDSGKSLVWDSVKDATLSKNATLNEARSETGNDFRFFESWEGLHAISRKPTRVFLCNRDVNFIKIYPKMDVLKLLQRLTVDDRAEYWHGEHYPIQRARELGDMLILTNQWPEDSNLHINITGKSKDWHRETQITVIDDRLKAAQEFLEQHCGVA